MPKPLPLQCSALSSVPAGAMLEAAARKSPRRRQRPVQPSTQPLMQHHSTQCCCLQDKAPMPNMGAVASRELEGTRISSTLRLGEMK